MTSSIPDHLYGARQEAYRAIHLDELDRELGDLDGFVGGSWEINDNAQVPGAGTVTLQYRGDPPMDYGKDRVKLVYEARAQGRVESWALGVFVIEAPKESYDDDTGIVTVSLKLMDKMSILEQDAIDGAFALPEGASVVPEVRDLIAGSDPSAVVLIEDSGKTLSSGMAWKAGTTVREIVKDLLSAINYEPIYVDREGQYRSSQYTLPLDRPVVHTFDTGARSLHRPDWGKSQDWFAVPNKIVGRTQGTQDEPGFAAVAENVDPDSKFSYPRRGNRWFVRTDDNLEASDEATLQSIVARRLVEASTKVTHISIEHAMLPVWPRERVALNAADYRGTATITKMRVNLVPGALVSAEWREASYE